VERGSLPLRRLESWQHLQRELRWIASRKDARLRSEKAAGRKRRSRDG
jgi:ribosome biogenesis GTPase